MPIRPRITDPYGTECKEIEAKIKGGPKKQAPRKPTAEERQPLERALSAIPIGTLLSHEDWQHKFVVPYLKMKFAVYGVELAIYPTATRTTNGKDRCTGVLIMQLGRFGARNCPTLQLTTPNKTIWYGRILNWIQEINYA